MLEDPSTRSERMNHQRNASKVESAVLSALDPTSTTVYYLANGGIILLLITLAVLYAVLQNGHLLVMMLLALGLLGSVNYVWLHRVNPEDDIADEKGQKNSFIPGTGSLKSQKSTPRKRAKKRRKE